jgi:hypothetical protein
VATSCGERTRRGGDIVTFSTLTWVVSHMVYSPGITSTAFKVQSCCIVGQGAIRFCLPLNAQLSNDYFAQAVIVTKGIKEREIVRARLEKTLDTEFASLNTRIYPFELGPPVGWPLQYRVSGQTPEGTRDAAFLRRSLGWL